MRRQTFDLIFENTFQNILISPYHLPSNHVETTVNKIKDESKQTESPVQATHSFSFRFLSLTIACIFKHMLFGFQHLLVSTHRISIQYILAAAVFICYFTNTKRLHELCNLQPNFFSQEYSRNYFRTITILPSSYFII